MKENKRFAFRSDPEIEVGCLKNVREEGGVTEISL
jgi:hypothetical protein